MSQKNYDPMMMGKRIQRLRESQHLSIEGLAKKAQLNKNTIVRIEAGCKKVNFDTVLKICDALNTTITKVIRGKPVSGIHYKIATGYRKDRTTISKESTFTIGDMNIHLSGGSLHAGILEIKGKGNKKSHQGEELLFCLTGTIELDVNGKKIIVNKGDGVAFWAAEPHSYSYIDSKKGEMAVCLSVIVGNKIDKLEDLLTHITHNNE